MTIATALVYLLAAVLFILGLLYLSSPKGARRGNWVAAMGMVLAGGAFAIAAVIQARLDAGGHVHALWQVLQYFVMTMAEVLVSITGLEFAYTQAPRRMKSTIMGLWLLFISVGDLIVAFLSPLEKKLSLSHFFWTPLL